MNKNLTNTLLSLSAILALSGCGTNSDYKASTSDKGSKLNTGLEGKVISNKPLANTKVCFDTNQDGICGKDEDFTITNQEGEYSFKKDVSSKNTNSILVANINSEYILASKQISSTNQNITPFTTLLINQNISKLKEALSIDEKLLNGQDYTQDKTAQENAEKLIKSYKEAYKSDSTKPLNTAISVSNKVVENKKYDVTITKVDEIKPSKVFEVKSLSKEVTWEKGDGDETVIGNTISDDQFINYSKWNNKLVVIDTSSQEPSIKENKRFLDVKGARHSIDSKTGASEQILNKVEASSDGNTLYSLTVKKEDSSKDIGVGIYKTNIATGIPSNNFATQSAGTNFYNDATINNINLSKDGTKLLATSSEKKILIFNTSDLTKPSKTISTNKKPISVLIDESNNYAFVGLEKRKKNSFGIYDLNTGELVGEYLTNEAAQFIVQSKNTIFISDSSQKKVYALNTSEKSNITLKDTFEVSGYIKNISISQNANHLLVSSNKTVTIFDIDDKTRKYTVTLPNSVNSAFELKDNKVIISYGESLAYYSIIDK